MRRLLLLLLPGCLFPSLDGLSGSADGSVSDVTNDVIVESASDAPLDAAPEASGPFCPQSNTVLCSDFDETNDAGFAGAWDYVFSPGTTTVQESTAFYTSAPRSLLVQTTSTDMTALARKDVGYTNGLTLEFDVRIAARGSNPSVCSFSSGVGSLALTMRATQTGISEATTLADGGTSYGGTSKTTVVPTDTWVHVIYDFDRTTKQLTVTIDGTVVITYKPTNGAWANLTTATVHLGVGSSDGETVYFDDVTIRSR